MAKKQAAYEAAAPATDKKKALETAMAQIKKNFGAGSIMRLGDAASMNVEVIPTGSLTLDLALGRRSAQGKNRGDLWAGIFR